MPKLQILNDSPLQGQVTKAQQGGMASGVTLMPNMPNIPTPDVTPVQRGMNSIQAAVQYAGKMQLAETKINASDYENTVSTAIYAYDEKIKMNPNVDDYTKEYAKLQEQVSKIGKNYTPQVQGFARSSIDNKMVRCSVRTEVHTRAQRVQNLRSTADAQNAQIVKNVTMMTKDVAFEAVDKNIDLQASTMIIPRNAAPLKKAIAYKDIEQQLVNNMLNSEYLLDVTKMRDDMDNDKTYPNIGKAGRLNAKNKLTKRIEVLRKEDNKKIIQLLPTGNFDKNEVDAWEKNNLVSKKLADNQRRIVAHGLPTPENTKDMSVRRDVENDLGDSNLIIDKLLNSRINAEQALNEIHSLYIPEKWRDSLLEQVKIIGSDAWKKGTPALTQYLEILKNVHENNPNIFGDTTGKREATYGRAVQELVLWANTSKDMPPEEMGKMFDSWVNKKYNWKYLQNSMANIAMGLPYKPAEKEKGFWSNFFGNRDWSGDELERTWWGWKEKE